MSVSLYDLSVASYLQTLTAISGCLDKGLAHATAQGIDPETLVQARLAPDMLPFRFQVESVAHHSIGAIEGLRRGLFTPPGEAPPRGYADLQRLLADAKDALSQVSAAEINALAGRDMAFEIRGRQIPFTAETFILSFSLPNFYFHAATAYDILRHLGVAVGKRDFLGPMRTRT
ncbi:MAG: DUF1993 domain-containing protein [Burkholderiales bacterium]|jgi:hypothetical protein